MRESHYQIYKDIKNVLKRDLHDSNTKDLITLAYVVLSGTKDLIALYIEKAIQSGASRKDFLDIISCIIGDAKLFSSINELLRILDFYFGKEEVR